ncbi:MAG: DUF2806 domain-containing protein, partial [bacterium]|nr:DUF2806 domain-containing protein [bacterium]
YLGSSPSPAASLRQVWSLRNLKLTYMADQNNSLINLGNLADPAKVLIEKISDAVGGVFKPYQIRRAAQARAEAEKIRAVSKIEISELQQRALNRFLFEEASKQNNIENIIRKALPAINAKAQSQKIENDWIVDFFDKSRLISDEEMQGLWGKVLAGEANAPGTYTKRTIYLLASLDKNDALLFTKLCSFIWTIGGLVPLIFNSDNELYTKNGINFISLKHLDSIGLISFESLSGYMKKGFKKKLKIDYGNKIITLEFLKENDNELSIGHAIFTDVGAQLATLCKSPVIDGTVEYALTEWAKAGVKEEGKI